MSGPPGSPPSPPSAPVGAVFAPSGFEISEPNVSGTRTPVYQAEILRRVRSLIDFWLGKEIEFPGPTSKGPHPKFQVPGSITHIPGPTCQSQDPGPWFHVPKSKSFPFLPLHPPRLPSPLPSPPFTPSARNQVQRGGVLRFSYTAVGSNTTQKWTGRPDDPSKPEWAFPTNPRVRVQLPESVMRELRKQHRTT